MIQPSGRGNSMFKDSGTGLFLIGRDRLSGELEDKKEVLGEWRIVAGLHRGHRQRARG